MMHRTALPSTKAPTNTRTIWIRERVSAVFFVSDESENGTATTYRAQTVQ